MFDPLRDPQLQFKSEKYKLNKVVLIIVYMRIFDWGGNNFTYFFEADFKNE